MINNVLTSVRRLAHKLDGTERVLCRIGVWSFFAIALAAAPVVLIADRVRWRKEPAI